MKVYIVTGTTRGIGKAIAEKVVTSNHLLLSLSTAPDKQTSSWINIQCDLRDHDSVGEKLKLLLQSDFSENYESVVMINNAGILDPIGPLQNVQTTQILNHLLVNQAAPAILMSAFLDLTEQFHINRRIINITSGAARKPYPGWAMYCASKAALDMMTLCVAEEQQYLKNPVSICSVSPGKVETEMQDKIRRAEEKDFPARQDFIDAKMKGKLYSPMKTAQLILALDDAGMFKNGGLYDLRTAVYKKGDYVIDSMNGIENRS